MLNDVEGSRNRLFVRIGVEIAQHFDDAFVAHFASFVDHAEISVIYMCPRAVLPCAPLVSVRFYLGDQLTGRAHSSLIEILDMGQIKCKATFTSLLHLAKCVSLCVAQILLLFPLSLTC